MPKTEFSTTTTFDNGFKKLKKKYPSLDDDFENMKKSLLRPHYEQNTILPNEAIFEIKELCGKNFKSCKIKKFACKSLKNCGVRSGFRFIYVITRNNDLLKITFIEIYHKKDKENEDKELIKDFIKELLDNEK